MEMYCVFRKGGEQVFYGTFYDVVKFLLTTVPASERQFYYIVKSKEA